MPYVANPLGAPWRPLRERGLGEDWSGYVTSALRRYLESWLGTPYGVGQQQPGAGVDCVRFVAAVLDFLRDSRTPLTLLPQDAAFHDRAGATAAMLRFRRAFAPIVPSDGSELEPGDVLVTGPPHGGPGHAILVGPDPGTTWEAGYGRVQRCGWVLPHRYRLFAVYRLGGRERWPIA